MGSPETGWVEERALGSGSRFAWRLDGGANLTIRAASRTAAFARKGLERLQGFMADGAWHPVSHEMEGRLEGNRARSVARSGRDELGWGRRQVEVAGQLGGVFANAGAWEWNGRTRGVCFRQVDGGLERVAAYHERRQRG